MTIPSYNGTNNVTPSNDILGNLVVKTLMTQHLAMTHCVTLLYLDV